MAKTNIYKKLKDSLSGVDSSKVVKKVMLIGYPMDATRYLTNDTAMFFYFIFDLEVRLMRFLKDNNYYVLYKAHPERLKELGNLVYDLADEVIVEKFEDSWKRADALIFTYPSTTTFGYALCTNRPVILLDKENSNQWNNEVKSELKKRCSLIHCKVSNQGRLMIDKVKLLQSLQNCSQDINYSVVDKYMIG